MKIGVTGTREGMNEHQFNIVKKYLTGWYCEGAEFHHGDCVGVDAEAAALAKEIGYKIVSHPGTGVGGLRAFVEFDESREPTGHFKRNRTIVDICDCLLVVPLHNEPQPRGGTWYTANYSKKTKKPYIIFYPDGREETGN
jgi:hypothetical protein